jgi:DNA-binding NtrC family response regulator
MLYLGVIIISDVKILIVNNDTQYIDALTTVLSRISKNVIVSQNFKKAIFELFDEVYDFVVTDVNLFNQDYTMKNFIDSYPSTDLIIVATKPSYSDGSVAIQNGASLYIDLKGEVSSLPYKLIHILNEKNRKSTEKENLLKEYLLDSNNESYKKMLSHCEKVAKTNVNILLTGESGTGKEVAAKYIHICSQRVNNNFVPVNCSSFTETLLESELFGYEQGSFTGAAKSRQGRFESANNGSLFLDEVGDIDLRTQVKLLRVLETKKVSRLGSNIERLIDFRLISATNKDLIDEIMTNNFREDFFYRISSITIRVPSLKERKEDLDRLVEYFLKKSQEDYNIEIVGIDEEPKNFLYSYEYPGNIRELKSIIDRMVVLSVNGRITKDGIPILYNIKHDNNFNQITNYDKIVTFKEFKMKTEANYITLVLEKTGGNVSEAARQLDISSRQLFNKIKEYDIKK